MSSGTGASAGQTFASGHLSVKASTSGRAPRPKARTGWHAGAAQRLRPSSWRTRGGRRIANPSGPVRLGGFSTIKYRPGRWGTCKAATTKGLVGTARWPGHMRAELVIDAVRMAIARRRLEADLIHLTPIRAANRSRSAARVGRGGVRPGRPSGLRASTFFTRRPLR